MAFQVNTASYHLPSVLNSESEKKLTLKQYNNKRFRKSSFKNNRAMATSIVGKLSSVTSKKKANDMSDNGGCASTQLSSNKRYKWHVGDKVDVKSLQSKLWHLCKIIEINRQERRLKIHYHNLNSKFDEWLSLRSTRIRSLNDSNTNQISDVDSDLHNDGKSLKKANVAKKSARASSPHSRIISSKKQSPKIKQSSKSSYISKSPNNNIGDGHSGNDSKSKSSTPVDSIKLECTQEDQHHSDPCNDTLSESPKEDGGDTTKTAVDTNTEAGSELSTCPKTYNTRHINKRYSLDTIVVDDSFNSSGVLNYHGGYIRTVTSVKPSLVSNKKRSSAGKSQAKPKVAAIKTESKSNKSSTNEPSSDKKKKSITSITAVSSQVNEINPITDTIMTQSNMIPSSRSLSAASECDDNISNIYGLSIEVQNDCNRDILSTSYQNRSSTNVHSNSTGDHKDNPVTQDEDSVSTSIREGAIQCVCQSKEDDGIMLQCEHCYHWQHGHCVGFASFDEIPQSYVCTLCCQPYFQQSSLPISCQTFISSGYFEDNKLNQLCRINPKIASVIANTFKLKNYVTALKRIISTERLNETDIDLSQHINELLDLYNKLKTMSEDSLLPIEEPVETPPTKAEIDEPIETPPTKSEIDESIETPPTKSEIDEPIQTPPTNSAIDEPIQTPPTNSAIDEPIQTPPANSAMDEPIQTPPTNSAIDEPIQTPSIKSAPCSDNEEKQ